MSGDKDKKVKGPGQIQGACVAWSELNCLDWGCRLGARKLRTLRVEGIQHRGFKGKGSNGHWRSSFSRYPELLNALSRVQGRLRVRFSCRGTTCKKPSYLQVPCKWKGNI